MEKYKPYSDSELNVLLHEPWQVSDRPYMLYTAYVLNCLYDICCPDRENDDEDETQGEMWGCTVPKRMLENLLTDAATDFKDAVDNHKPVKIWERACSIRKVRDFNPELLKLAFQFPLKNNEYIITKEGAINLTQAADDTAQEYETIKEQAKVNRTYLRQIIMMAEDDKNNGWDKLTDMEILMYCWALFYNKHQQENWPLFKQEYKDYFYVEEKEAVECFIPKAAMRQSPVGMCTFSFEKVDRWNKSHGQNSIAKTITPNEADNFWYDIALKKTFKPAK